MDASCLGYGGSYAKFLSELGMTWIPKVRQHEPKEQTQQTILLHTVGSRDGLLLSQVLFHTDAAQSVGKAGRSGNIKGHCEELVLKVCQNRTDQKRSLQYLGAQKTT